MKVAIEDPIPPALLLVRDFVNTVEWQIDNDSWQDPSDLAGWCTNKLGWQGHDLNADDLDLAKRLREGLRSVLLMHAGHYPFAKPLEELNDALRRLPLRMSFDDGGAFSLSAAGASGIAPALTPVLSAVEAARADGNWTRLKACSRDTCRWAYWDNSRNQSGRWCSMAGCGNYIKMRRRNGYDVEAGEDTIAVSGTRVPTMVDVAGLAGVSIKTVSNVVTGSVNVAEATRSRVTAAIEELDYRPNLAARALAAGRPRKTTSSEH
ncbi:putative RNA-binding Zn ribbon-like protein [Okibacterium sp. HSC-33S16]|uniref:CGNR zinc finger domain-containing protein n=1 Tax=Okibacterium sp. HSC-33S16 TaxID=2910965 RepID=UPI0027E35011|nr:LacI family DNA-binding transcriptional regulator [Okibacterium sp. HSC-33S16]MCP2030738.1 putative RNA-binding Zn ribbon-like protein [Okibacterium sp. HSC-33S16]